MKSPGKCGLDPGRQPGRGGGAMAESVVVGRGWGIPLSDHPALALP